MIVPRSKRRGILSQLCLVSETEVATAKRATEKRAITLIVALCGAVGPFGSAITLRKNHKNHIARAQCPDPTFPAVLGPIADTYGASPTVVTLALAIYMLALALFPLWWSSASELFGRRSTYIVSNAGLAIFGVLSAVSPSMTMFLVMRFFTGGAASAALSVGAGTIADIWEPKERGKAMAYYLLGTAVWAIDRPFGGWCAGRRPGLEKYHVVSGHLRR